MNVAKKSNKAIEIVVQTRDYFSEVVSLAIKQRGIRTLPLVENYLVEMLEFFMSTSHLFNENSSDGKRKQETLAEMYFKATVDPIRIDLLKKLGDTALYVSGFFGDSLNRKVVDVDYYAEMGGSAYGLIAKNISEESFAEMYNEFSDRFLEFVDVLTYISQEALIQTNDDLLRLYDRYIITGSSLARDQILNKGLLTTYQGLKTKIKQ